MSGCSKATEATIVVNSVHFATFTCEVANEGVFGRRPRKPRASRESDRPLTDPKALVSPSTVSILHLQLREVAEGVPWSWSAEAQSLDVRIVPQPPLATLAEARSQVRQNRHATVG